MQIKLDITNEGLRVQAVDGKAEQALKLDGNALDVTEAAELQGLVTKGEAPLLASTQK